MDTIPMHILSTYIQETKPDVAVSAALLLVNKEWHRELKGNILHICRTQYIHDIPGLVEMYEEYSGKSFEYLVQHSEICMVGLLKALQNMQVVYQRKKGQRYKSLLKPLVDRSLIRDNVMAEDRHDHITLTLMFLFVAIGYVQRQFPVTEPQHINVMIWCMYLIYDYMFYLYSTLPSAHDLLHNAMFKNIIFLNIQHIHTLPYRSYLGNTLTYQFERLMQKLEYIMFCETIWVLNV